MGIGVTRRKHVPPLAYTGEAEIRERILKKFKKT